MMHQGLFQDGDTNPHNMITTALSGKALYILNIKEKASGYLIK